MFGMFKKKEDKTKDKLVAFTETELFVQAIEVRRKEEEYRSRAAYLAAMLRKADPKLLEVYKELIDTEGLTEM